MTEKYVVIENEQGYDAVTLHFEARNDAEAIAACAVLYPEASVYVCIKSQGTESTDTNDQPFVRETDPDEEQFDEWLGDTPSAQS